jgi:hypothetical protein
MIDHVDEALRNLLLRELPFLGADRIYFETPDREFKPGLPAIDLFLYDVRENMDLRDNETRSLRGNGTATTWRSPVRVDCSYLITAWAGDIKGEHTILGAVMSALLRHSTLPPEILPMPLREQEAPLPTSVLQPSHLQSVGEFWQALDGKPKAALNYKVTVAIQPFAPIELPLVVESSAEITPVAREDQ